LKCKEQRHFKYVNGLNIIVCVSHAMRILSGIWSCPCVCHRASSPLLFFFFARIPCTFIPCPQLFTPLSPNRRIRLEYSTDTFSIAPNTNGTRAGGVKRLLQSVKPVAGRRMALIWFSHGLCGRQQGQENVASRGLYICQRQPLPTCPER